MPIGHGLVAALASTANGDEAKSTRPAAKAGQMAFPAGRRRNGSPAAAQVRPVAVTVPPSFENHPELGEGGEMIRRPNRTMVAEAHRRALERRENERAASLSRRDEQHAAAISSIYKPGQEPARSGQEAPVPAATNAGSGLPLHTRPLEPALTESPKPAIPTAASEAPTPIGSPAGASESRAIDRVIPPTEPTERTLPSSNVIPPAAAPSLAPREEAATLPPVALTGNDLPSSLGKPVRQSPLPTTPARDEVPNVSNNTRRWDDLSLQSRFQRLRQESRQESTPRPVNVDVHQAATLETPVVNVGRAADDVPPLIAPPSGRGIRPLNGLGATAPVEMNEPVPAPVVSTPPARLQRPSNAANEVRPVETMPVAPAPRRVDEQLIKQMRQEWHERALAAHSGQRCGTCRYFQAAESAERGSCSCPLAESFRQSQGRQDLGCLNTFGTWWAADDNGWLQKTYTVQRQQTPLVDRLLWEQGIVDAPPSAVASAEPQRKVR